jgi:hypothetical protein
VQRSVAKGALRGHPSVIAHSTSGIAASSPKRRIGLPRWHAQIEIA